MEIKENMTGLNRNINKETSTYDITKKQNSATIKGSKEWIADQKINNVHQEAVAYAKEEHRKADNWESHPKTD